MCHLSVRTLKYFSQTPFFMGSNQKKKVWDKYFFWLQSYQFLFYQPPFSDSSSCKYFKIKFPVILTQAALKLNTKLLTYL